MSDLISRQAAIDEIRRCRFVVDAIEKISKLPSAQPEQSSEIQDILEYLDTVLHPIVSPDHWNVYSELHDMISMLPSAQPEQRWIPVTERLPEKEGWYITTVESEKTGKRRIENDLFAIDIALAHGHTPNKFCKDGYRQRTVAWMPFPEPYREDGEKK